MAGLRWPRDAAGVTANGRERGTPSGVRGEWEIRGSGRQRGAAGRLYWTQGGSVLGLKAAYGLARGRLGAATLLRRGRAHVRLILGRIRRWRDLRPVGPTGQGLVGVDQPVKKTGARLPAIISHLHRNR